ncbi:LysE family translocator [Rathayibacter sp. VKM Ac-2926]|uniref:LysE family translocator n=1 Tax=Rathayibacter sp. VKM Ac-2926 TaxID=2929477 RepID=UPI001FB1ED8A|nr:LysE family translocator [Rathayibacter sp. VKM Ac-2926]MCJ1705505.1 LysE family translocator [Rathayibacter sp. VKM Ac-2926]
MPVETVGAFWLVSIALAITPGADWAFAIAAGLRGRVVPAAVAGLLLGHALHAAIVAAGVGALLAALPGALTVLTIAGAGYLLWLGVGTLRRPPVPRADGELAPDRRSRWLLRGFGISGLNPKVFLLFLALLPQFTRPDAPLPLVVQIVLLAALHIATCAVVYLGVGFGARAVLSTRPAAARVVSRVSGAAMIGIGLFLLVEQIAHLTTSLT